MLFVGTSIIHPSTEGVFLLCNILDLLIYSYYDILLKFCSERNIPVIEISEDEYYWGIIKYVILQIYDENIARLIYFKLTHDNISNYK